MKTFLAVLYFGYFGFAWPVYIGKHTRGYVSLACIAAPWAAFWLGWFVK